MYKSSILTVLLLSLMAVPGFAEAKQKNHKHQIVVVSGLRIDIQRVDNKKHNGRITPHVVFLSYDNPKFRKAPTKEIRLDTTGFRIIHRFTGCVPLPGLIVPNTMMSRSYSYVQIEVSCP
ncbi:MAG: hypothetical protein ACI861_001178 [Paracoccaceae bacterium]|jgi:hypothetical protein